MALNNQYTNSSIVCSDSSIPHPTIDKYCAHIVAKYSRVIKKQGKY